MLISASSDPMKFKLTFVSSVPAGQSKPVGTEEMNDEGWRVTVVKAQLKTIQFKLSR